ncbi:MAG: hypothetical protein JRJ39_00030 [Deltaproteobacteria bacterium]|nr:hypothetical protein [Deltaproteobacteria bacterium]
MPETIINEIANLAHTLSDINFSVQYSKKLIQNHIKLIKRLEPRIESLKTRIDELTKQSENIDEG